MMSSYKSHNIVIILSILNLVMKLSSGIVGMHANDIVRHKKLIIRVILKLL